jgi:hypothetical protein
MAGQGCIEVEFPDHLPPVETLFFGEDFKTLEKIQGFCAPMCLDHAGQDIGPFFQEKILSLPCRFGGAGSNPEFCCERVSMAGPIKENPVRVECPSILPEERREDQDIWRVFMEF